MRITAHREADPGSGEVVSESFHDFEITIDTLKAHFASVFTLDEQINTKGLEMIVAQVKAFRTLIKTLPIQFRGSSLLFVINNLEGIYRMKFIDICGFQKLELSEFDKGLTHGLSNLIKLLENIGEGK